MSNGMRWQILVPRVLAVVVGLLAVQFVLGLAVRSTAVRTGERATGGCIELEHAKVSLWDRQMVLSDMRLGAHGGGESLLEADRCELNFAGTQLFHEQAIVDRGRISGLRFGLLPGFGGEKCDQASAAMESMPSSALLADDGDPIASAWLAHLAERFSNGVISRLDSVVQTEALYSEWSSRSAELMKRCQQLDERAAELQKSVEVAQANPLRNDKFFKELPAKFAEVKNEFENIRAAYESLPDWLDTQRRVVVAARRSDGETLRECLQLEPIEANALTAYLLRKQAAAPINELVLRLRSIRDVVPAAPLPGQAPKRGEDILFAGCQAGPGVLVRTLELQGTGRCGGQPVELRGLLTDFNSAPSLHSQPIRLQLATTGSLRLELQATIDRTGPVARDELLVDCDGILLPQVSLGSPEEFEIGLAPSVGMLSVRAIVDGEKLSGEVRMVQTDVRMTPAMHGNLAGVPVCPALSDRLSHVNHVAVRVTIGGTLGEPTCTLWSNLGPAVAESMEQSLERVADSHSKTLLAQAGKRVDERLAELERQISEQQSKFASQKSSLSNRLDSIAGQQGPQYRISAKQSGRQLPVNSLFR